MKSLIKSLAVIVFLGSFLFLGSVNIADKADLVSWDPAPIPTVESVTYSPDEIMMGAHTVSEAYPKELKFKAVNPEDYDTKKTTSVSSESCISLPKLELVEDSVEDPQWLIANPNEFFVTNELEIEGYPVPWEWDYHGEGEYGSFAFAVGLFTVSDGRSSSDPRRDEPEHFVTGEILKLIPDKMNTFLKEDGLFGGCAGFPYPDGSMRIHLGAEFYHPIWNRSYTGFSFAGMVANEELFFPITNGNTELVSTILQDIIAAAIYPSTADPQSRMNDVHMATGGMAEIFENDEAGITSVTFLQKWHITTGDWNGCNPFHCIGRHIGGLPHAKTIQYDYYNPMFTRVTKDGVTCNCPDPSKCLH